MRARRHRVGERGERARALIVAIAKHEMPPLFVAKHYRNIASIVSLELSHVNNLVNVKRAKTTQTRVNQRKERQRA